MCDGDTVYTDMKAVLEMAYHCYQKYMFSEP